MGKRDLLARGRRRAKDTVESLEGHRRLLLRHLHGPDHHHGLSCLVGETKLDVRLHGGLINGTWVMDKGLRVGWGKTEKRWRPQILLKLTCPLLTPGGRAPVTAYFNDSIIVVLPQPLFPTMIVRGE